MPELILHVGSLKAGSTYIQRFLRRNHVILRQLGYGYPHFLESADHFRLSLMIEPYSDEHRAYGYPTEQAVARHAQQIHRMFDEQVRPGQRWLISSERFATMLRTPELVRATTDFFRPHFESIKILLFVRRQDFLLPSIYTQLVREGQSPEWSAELVEQEGFHLQLLELADLWASDEGSDFLCLPYLEHDDGTNSVLDPYLAAAGLPADLDWVMPDPQRAGNPRLDAEAFEFLSLINPYIPRVLPDGTSNIKHRAKVVRTVAQTSRGPQIQLDPQLLRVVYEENAVANTELVAKFGGGQSWEQWLGWPTQFDEASEDYVLTQQRLVELMVELSAPNGPVDWGQPGSKPAMPANTQSSLRRVAAKVKKLSKPGT